MTLNQSDFEEMLDRINELDEFRLGEPYSDDEMILPQAITSLIRFVTRYETACPSLCATHNGHIAADWHLDWDHHFKGVFDGTDKIEYVKFEQVEQTNEIARTSDIVTMAEFYELMPDRWKKK